MTRRIDNYKNNNFSTISNKNRAEIDFPLEKIVKKKKKRTFHTISFSPNDRKSTCVPIEQFLTSQPRKSVRKSVEELTKETARN